MQLVYVITRSDSIGGAHIHVRDMAQALLECNHQVTVLVGGEGPFTEELGRHSIPYRSIPSLVRPIHPLRDVRALMDLRSAIDELSPDLVSLHSSKAGWLGRIVGYQLKIPTIFTAHGWAFAEGVPRIPATIYRWAESLTAPLAHTIITVSEYDRRLAQEYGIVPEDKLVTIHNGVKDIPGDLRADPANGEVPRLMMVARFEEQKDHRSLLQALAGLTDQGWTLDFVGDGPLRSAIEQMASGLGLRDRIRFLGSRLDIPQLLQKAHIFLLISKWEGFPRTILEAMRAGLPVIASDVGGVREAVVHGETGFIAPRHEVSLLREYLRILIANSSLRANMGASGRHRYENQFTFARMFDRTLAIYNKALG